MNPNLLPVLLFLPVLGGSFYFGYTPLLLSVLFGTISLITFAIYYKDKAAAINGAWRTPENTLHLFALLCGWPGAIVAQQTLRHKTQKQRFRFIFWLTVCLNLSAFSWLHTTAGSHLLATYIQRLDYHVQHDAVLHPVASVIMPLLRFHARN